MIVAHSQGNLYVPWLKKQLSQDGYDPSFLMSVGLANPSANSYSPYFNHRYDAVLRLLSTLFPVLSLNFFNDSQEFGHHGLIETYLSPGEPLNVIQILIALEDENLEYDTRYVEALSLRATTNPSWWNVAHSQPFELNGKGLDRVSNLNGLSFTLYCHDLTDGDYILSSQNTYETIDDPAPLGSMDWSMVTPSHSLASGSTTLYPVSTTNLDSRQALTSWRVKTFRYYKTIESIP